METYSVVVKTFLKCSRRRPRPCHSALKTKAKTLVSRSWDRDRDRHLGAEVSRWRTRPCHSPLKTKAKTLVSRSRDRDRDRHLGAKVLRRRPRPCHSVLKTKDKTLVSRSRDRDQDLNKMNLSALESPDLDLEITTLQTCCYCCCCWLGSFGIIRQIGGQLDRACQRWSLWSVHLLGRQQTDWYTVGFHQ